MSTDVASSRRILLGQYLISVVNSCLSFDTPEQDLIFKFLGGYDHIINDITEGYPVLNDWSQQSYPVLLSRTENSTLATGQGQGTAATMATGGAGGGQEGNGSRGSLSLSTSSSSAQSSSFALTTTAASAWKNGAAPFAAVFLSACMIVISFMGHIIK
jgi:hypothetical protein